MNTSTINLNNDINKIKNWAIQWKIIRQIIIKRQIIVKFISITVPLNKFILKNIFKCILILNWIFRNINNVPSKVNKIIVLLRKLQAFLLGQALVTAYKAFIRPHLDYGDIIYDQTYNDSIHQKMESIQHNGALTITGITRGTSREKRGLESVCKDTMV